MEIVIAPALLRMCSCLALLLVAGCTAIGQYSSASFNVPLVRPAEAATPAPPVRTTFRADGARGNERVLMFLSLSGGGSRAAYLSAATMHALQEIGLLQEVDVISAVSGGSIAAAYYTASRDDTIDDPTLASALAALGAARPPQLALEPPRIRCTSALSADEERTVRTLAPVPMAGERVVQLCRAGEFPPWERGATLDTMKKNFILRWFGNLLWPPNLGRYWFSSFDRSDIMVDTLASGALHRRGGEALFKQELRMRDLNPLRPYLLIGSTNATRQTQTDGTVDEFPFGSTFTFTDEDFRDRICSDINDYSLARAVMSSSAFPLFFATMSLENFRDRQGRCRPREGTENRDRRFLHLIDGGNADNLGLRAVKRMLLEMSASGELRNYDRVIVLQIDAFTTPEGTGPHKPDPRSVLDLLLDTNVTDAVDALLQSNRDRLLDDFDSAQLHFERECAVSRNAVRHFSYKLCEQLESAGATLADGQRRAIDLRGKLVFFHFGFADVVRGPDDADGVRLREQLDLIPTSLSIDDDDRKLVQSTADDGYEFQRQDSSTSLIERAVGKVIRRDHPCIAELIELVRESPVEPATRVRKARETCLAEDRRR